MKNPSKKLQEAIFIIRKFYSAVNVQRTDNEDIVYLFDYSLQKKTIGSDKINKAVEKAAKQQDFPKDVHYSEGMLTLINAEIKEVIEEPKKEHTEIFEAEPETVVEDEPKPKKRRSKKQTDLDA